MWEPPSEVEEYRIVRALGAGAMGTVYLAHDTLLDRSVAIKFINALDIDASARERFFVEARAVARLAHPNVVAVYRVGEVRERPYLVSEYLPGASLAATAKPMAWHRALKIGIGLARGLGAAHRRGVLHRDIKPANIMLGEDDDPKLLDFGLAKIVDGSAVHLIAIPTRPESASANRSHGEADATLSARSSAPPAPGADAFATTHDAGLHHTREGAILGTPLYLAPELWCGASASRESDVYALGMVLHELLAGQVPHAGLSRHELVTRVTTEDPVPIATRVASLPAQLAAVIDACCHCNPSERPASGDALCELLQTVRSWFPTRDDAMREVGRAPLASTAAGERKVVAVLYADMRDFGSLSETGQPVDVLSRLNDYFDRMVEAITSHGGTVDKFVGDGVVAVFGGATALTNPAEAALDAAISMRAKLRQLNHQRVEAGLAPIDNGIGVTFGEVLYGPVGSLDRKDVTVLGDVVNAALQLEATTVDLRVPILTSASVADALPPARRNAVRSLGEVVVKGRRQPMLVYAAADLDENTSPRTELRQR